MKNLKFLGKLTTLRIVLMVCIFSCIFNPLLVMKRLDILSWESGVIITVKHLEECQNFCAKVTI